MPYTVTTVEVHATGLRLPTHLGLTDEGQLLVSEFGGRAVRDVTEPGDYSESGRGVHAAGLEHPGGILPLDDGTIVVADSAAGTIYDISDAGKLSSDAAIAEGYPAPYGLVQYHGRLLVSFFSDGSLGIAPVERGAHFRAEAAFVWDFPCATTAEPYPQVDAYGGSWPTATRGDRLLLGHSSLGTVWDVSEGGDFNALRRSRFAWGLSTPRMIADPLDDDLYVVERTTGVIRRVAEEGYARFAPPLLAGFHEPSCLRFTGDGRRMYVADKALGAIYRADVRHHD